MGLLVDGIWKDHWYDTKSSGGRFKRQDSAFRNWITADGTAGPSGDGGFKAEAGRYHLYVSLACPWAHRTLILRELKGLNDMIGVDIVHPFMADHGWTFKTGFPDAAGDSINGKDFLYEVYLAAKPDYTGRVTVPTLWDKERATIVSNESSEIIRMLNSAFDNIGAKEGDYYPAKLRGEIDAINERILNDINNGVYKSGFATSQEAYEEAFSALFDSLDWVEDLLGSRLFLAGNRLTEADWRLFTTLVRFDAVYHGHFKCNKRRIRDYPNLSNYLRALYQHPGIAGTVNMEHIKFHYYASHASINPTRIVPVGPEEDLGAPHNRG